MIATKDKASRMGGTGETQPGQGQEQATARDQFYGNNNTTFTGIQVVKAYRTIRRASVSSTWIKPRRPGVWWNGVAFSV